jgi:exodeoxyribonuclease VII small subunit
MIIKMSFEESVSRLDEIIEQLSGGEIPLEKSVQLYQEGLTIVSECRKNLDEAQLKVSAVGAKNE